MKFTSIPDQFVTVVVLAVVLGSVSGLRPAHSQIEDGLQRAQSLETRNEITRARKLYQEYLKDHPTSVDAARGLTRTGIRTGDWGLAEKALNRLKKIDSESPSTAKLGTMFYFRQGAYDTAIAWGRRYRDRKNESWEPFHYLAQAYLKNGQLISAEEMVESARLRTEDNPWVLLDKLLVEVNGDRVDEALGTAEELRKISTDPTVYWYMLRGLSREYDVADLARYFARGARGLPPGTPPLLESVDEDRYRYWWSRMTYRTGDNETARRALGTPPETFRSQWLQAHLTADPTARKRARQRVLDRWPDRLTAQWQHSRLVKGTEPLGSSRRTKSARYFYDEYTRNRYLDFKESALSALLRSLEMNPVNADNQFELARYYRNRGWERKERMAASRARTLGYDPPSRMEDYLEGLEAPDTGSSRTVPRPRIGVRVHPGSPWKGPLDGESVLESIIRQNVFHQPGFQGYRESIDSENELSSLVQDGVLDGGIHISVEDWGSELTATVEFYLPSNRIVTREFYDNDEMKQWNLLNTTMATLKNEWPWNGTIYKVTDDGAWVNLGRIHGINEGDTFTYSTPESAYPKRPTVDKIFEDRLRLSFPSPYYRTVVPRGIDVEILRN